jgi:hypothetical protein
MASLPSLMARQSDKPNVLARVSLLLSLAPYLGVALFPVVYSLADVFPGPREIYFVLTAIAAILVVSGIVMEPTAIITGHIALIRAKNYAAQHARRGSAIVALILGYVGLVSGAFLLLMQGK